MQHDTPDWTQSHLSRSQVGQNIGAPAEALIYSTVQEPIHNNTVPQTATYKQAQIYFLLCFINCFVLYHVTFLFGSTL